MPTWYQGLETLFGRHADRVIEVLHRIERKLDYIMTLVSVDDSVLATIGTELGNILTGVQTIVAAETNPLQPADLTVITGPITAIQNALASPSTPVVPTPAPVDPTPAPVDPTPVDPAPVDPTPVDPNPVVDPSA